MRRAFDAPPRRSAFFTGPQFGADPKNPATPLPRSPALPAIPSTESCKNVPAELRVFSLRLGRNITE